MKTAKLAIQEAASGGASLVVLPEIWNSAYETSEFPKNAEDIDAGKSGCADFMSQAAKEHAITLVGGSIPESSGGNVYNTCLVYDKAGRLLAKHRKVHLFDIDIPGKQTFKESDTLTAGKSLTVVDTECGRLGIGICYDIRFPEMAAIYAQRGVQLLVYPGAFNTTTGPAHWELLQKARAVDNQLFVATCSPANNPDASYSAHGHSMAVSPWGQILAAAGTGPQVVFANIDFSESETRRTNMPLAAQRRKDLYELIDKMQ